MNIDHIQLSPNLHNSQQFLELIYILVNLIHPLFGPITEFLDDTKLQFALPFSKN